MAGWSIRTFASMTGVHQVVVVTEPDYVNDMRELIDALVPQGSASIVAGGPSRQASVRNGLLAVDKSCDAVFVHDGARPLVREEDVRAGMAIVGPGRGAVLAAPVVDTIKVVESGTRRVLETLDRSALWAAQTPQFAMREELIQAHLRAVDADVAATDDAALLEWTGVEVVVVPASAENFKVTLPEDVARAVAFLQAREPVR